MIRIICPGKTEPKELEILQNYYLMLIRKWTKIEMIEIKAKSYKEECEKILKTIKYKPILLDVEGELFSTEEFSKFLLNNVSFGIDFIIGGPFGVCEEIKKFKKISLSRMTFNHNLIRIMFLEQIYRAFNPKFNK